jgi:hypothetical protein
MSSPAGAGWFEQNRQQVGTLGYKAVNEGRLIYGQ